MKEKIYTIPLTDAFNEGGECPFCTIEKKLEAEQVSYALGASMMEPDSRILSNEKGYCRRHYEKMSQEAKALSLGLVLDTHLNVLIQKLEAAAKTPMAKGGLFKKATGEDPVIEVLEQKQHSCLICDKLQYTLDKFADVFWYLYKTEPDFKKKVANGQGFCLPHFQLLLSRIDKELSGKVLLEARAEIIDLELKHLKRMNDEINWFTKKFDYRNQNEPWGNSKDAPQRVMEKLAKFM